MHTLKKLDYWLGYKLSGTKFILTKKLIKLDIWLYRVAVAKPKQLYYDYLVRRRMIAVEKEIREAKRLAKLHGCKYLVINWQGKPKAVPKWLIKKRLAMRYFAKGTTMQDFEKYAMYITH